MKKDIWFDKRKQLFACQITDEKIFSTVVNWGKTPEEAENNAMNTRSEIVKQQMQTNFRINMKGQRV